jgi:hypothetical protein
MISPVRHARRFPAYDLRGQAPAGIQAFWIPRSRDCVAITLKWNIVILNEVKNLIESMPYKTAILRLKPQNDIATQSLDRGIRSLFLWIPASAGMTYGVKLFLRKDTKL